MKTSVYCRTTEKGIQTFYLQHENQRYYLFNQDYRVSVRDYFRGGITLNEALSFNYGYGEAIKRTKSKLYKYIKYIEDEYGIVVLNATKKKNDKVNNNKRHKVEKYRYSDDDLMENAV